jgi:group II intron reverse transcriptase/maturase
VSLERARHQKSDVEPELAQGARGDPLNAPRSGEARTAARGNERSGTGGLMEEVVAEQNVRTAIKRVRKKKGSPGIDGMTVDELVPYLVGNWPVVKARLLDGTYEPTAVRKVEIPKPGGGLRTLGIPTVLDRFVQQCILQVLQPRFDPTFSESSHGFRPGRSAHGAVRAAQLHARRRKTWVVDVDLEKFFDRVNHDVLMGRLEKRITAKQMLAIIRRFLSAGMMADGVVVEREEGTPQGGPLSPLLANVLLDEVDKELEKRGHGFVRYADDLNVYVSSERAGGDVMELLRRLFTGLRLKINESKSAVAPCWTRRFLGFTLGRGRNAPIQIASKSLEKMKERVRKMTSRNSGRAIEQVVQDLAKFLPGWKNYFRIACTAKIFRGLDEWMRRRLRALHLSRWKNGWRTFAELRRLGASGKSAASAARGTRRYWNTSQGAIDQTLTVAYFDGLGLPRLYQTSTL